MTLCGWVNRRRDSVADFIDMRDREGSCRDFSIRICAGTRSKLASELRNQFCIQVTGTVRARRKKY
ncbi:hypothetical protein ACNKHV_11525 [Shigella flexneri]